jgi:heme/copper-type cytochrome/quinol oxidase subunit 4
MVFQTLNLTTSQKTKVRRLLLYYLKQENRFYVYEHFLDNCSTKIRDVIDKAMDGELKKQSFRPVDLTFRDYVHRMMAGVPYLDFILNFILNDSVDQPITDWDSMFLPDRLMAVIQQSTNPALGNVALVKSRKEKNVIRNNPFFTQKANPVNTMVREFVLGFFLLAIIGLSAIFYIKNHRFFLRFYPALISVFGLIFGMLGLILFFMMCFTGHKDTFWNENILLLNPFTLLLFFTGITAVFGKFWKLFSWIGVVTGFSAIVAFGLKTLPMFDQANGQQLRVLLPALLIIGITGLVKIKQTNHP